MPIQVSSPTSTAEAATPNYVAPAGVVPSLSWSATDAVKAFGDGQFTASQEPSGGPAESTYWIRTTGYGFALPAGASIVEVTVLCGVAGNGRFNIAGLKLISANLIQGDDLRSGSPGAAEGLAIPAGSPDPDGSGWTNVIISAPDWGLALTSAIVNAVDFGFAIGFSSALTSPVLVEYMAMMVQFSTAVEITTDVVFNASVSGPGASVVFRAAVAREATTDVAFLAAVASGITIVTPDPTSCPVITTAAMVITWTMPIGANGFRVVIYSDNSGSGDVIYDSGYIGSTATTHTIPVGKLPSPEAALYLQLTVTDANGATTVSDLICFGTSFPTSVNISGVATRAVGDGCDDPTVLPGIRITWTQVVPGGGETFSTYDVRRRRAGDTLWQSIATVGTIATTFYVDHNVLSGQTYEYSVVWRATQGASTLQSADTAGVTGKSIFEFAWLHTGNLQSDDANFLGVRLDSWEAEKTLNQELRYSQPWGRALPNVYVGQALGHTITVPLHPHLLTNRERWEALSQLVTLQRNQSAVLCLRFGRAREMYYVTLPNGLNRRDGQKDQTVTLAFRETFSEDPI